MDRLNTVIHNFVLVITFRVSLKHFEQFSRVEPGIKSTMGDEHMTSLRATGNEAAEIGDPGG